MFIKEEVKSPSDCHVTNDAKFVHPEGEAGSSGAVQDSSADPTQNTDCSWFSSRSKSLKKAEKLLSASSSSSLKCYPWLETDAFAAGRLVGLYAQLTETLHHKFRGGWAEFHQS